MLMALAFNMECGGFFMKKVYSDAKLSIKVPITPSLLNCMLIESILWVNEHSSAEAIIAMPVYMS